MDYDFLARLRNGESVEEIANELTKNLNEANKQHIQEQSSDPPKDKFDYAIDLLEALEALLRLYGQNDAADLVEETEAADVIDTFDRLVPFFTFLQQYKDAQDTDKKDPLGDFLDKFVN